MQVCSQCKKEKSIDNFYFRKDQNKYRKDCIDCRAAKDKIYYNKHREEKLVNNKKYQEENKEKISIQRSGWRQNNKSIISETGKKYRKNNLDKITEYQLEYRKTNSEKLAEYQRNYRINNPEKVKKSSKPSRDRRRKNPINKLHHTVSKRVREMVKNKNGNSISKYLPYSWKILKEHLESKFEPWMNWDNWGVYNASTWDDNDFSTWVWQIDHINPRSDLPYSSMDDENFLKCWDLNNLRPYSAKLNTKDGGSKIRHNKGKK